MLVVNQRGTDAVLQFGLMPPIVMGSDGELLELERIEILVMEQRYPALTSRVLLLALDRERRERRDAAVLAVAAAEEAALQRQQAAELAAAIAAALAAGDEPPLPEEDDSEPEEEVAPEDLPTAEELALERVPSTVRSDWREGEVFEGTVLEAAHDLEIAVNDLWTYLGMPTAIVDVSRAPRLPDPALVVEAAGVVAATRDYEEPIDAGTFELFAEVAASIPIAEINSYVDGGLVQFVHPLGQPTIGDVRTRYFFGVRAVTDRGRESPIVRVVGLAPEPVPLAPPAILAEATAGGVYLIWDAPVTDILGRPIDGEEITYKVFRRALSGPPTGAQLLTPVALETREFLDTTMVWNDPYTYEVRATSQPATLVDEATAPLLDPMVIVVPLVAATAAAGGVPRPEKESGGITTEELRVIDVFAPPSVLNLTGVRAGARVTLRWDPVILLDLRGYRIYRHAGPGPELPEPLPGITYQGYFPPVVAIETTVEGEPVEGEPAAEPVRARGQLRNRLADDGWEMLTPVIISENRFIDPVSDDTVSWVYVVEAVDASGNVSLAASTTVMPEERS